MIKKSGSKEPMKAWKLVSLGLVASLTLQGCGIMAIFQAATGRPEPLNPNIPEVSGISVTPSQIPTITSTAQIILSKQASIPATELKVVTSLGETKVNENRTSDVMIVENKPQLITLTRNNKPIYFSIDNKSSDISLSSLSTAVTLVTFARHELVLSTLENPSVVKNLILETPEIKNIAINLDKIIDKNAINPYENENLNAIRPDIELVAEKVVKNLTSKATMNLPNFGIQAALPKEIISGTAHILQFSDDIADDRYFKITNEIGAPLIATISGPSNDSQGSYDFYDYFTVNPNPLGAVQLGAGIFDFITNNNHPDRWSAQKTQYPCNDECIMTDMPSDLGILLWHGFDRALRGSSPGYSGHKLEKSHHYRLKLYAPFNPAVLNTPLLLLSNPKIHEYLINLINNPKKHMNDNSISELSEEIKWRMLATIAYALFLIMPVIELMIPFSKSLKTLIGELKNPIKATEFVHSINKILIKMSKNEDINKDLASLSSKIVSMVGKEMSVNVIEEIFKYLNIAKVLISLVGAYTLDSRFAVTDVLMKPNSTLPPLNDRNNLNLVIK